MKNKSTSMPTSMEFNNACRNEFAYLRNYVFHEVSRDQLSDFEVAFENDSYEVRIVGENWGQHAGVMLRDKNGRKAPPIMFVPYADRTHYKIDGTIPQQLADIRRMARVIEDHCSSVFA